MTRDKAVKAAAALLEIENFEGFMEQVLDECNEYEVGKYFTAHLAEYLGEELKRRKSILEAM